MVGLARNKANSTTLELEVGLAKIIENGSKRDVMQNFWRDIIYELGP